MALRFDLSGNPLPGPVDRLRGSVVRRLEASATDPRDAEIASLKARVAELEAALAAVNTVNTVNKPVTVNTPVNAAVNTETDRKAYMRDYMRQKRSAQKIKNSTP